MRFVGDLGVPAGRGDGVLDGCLGFGGFAGQVVELDSRVALASLGGLNGVCGVKSPCIAHGSVHGVEGLLGGGEVAVDVQGFPDGEAEFLGFVDELEQGVALEPRVVRVGRRHSVWWASAAKSHEESWWCALLPSRACWGGSKGVVMTNC